MREQTPEERLSIRMGVPLDRYRSQIAETEARLSRRQGAREAARARQAAGIAARSNRR